VEEVNTVDVGEQVRVRKEKLALMKKESYPYPNDVKVNALATEVKFAANNEELSNKQDLNFIIAGRIASFRLMGKAAFCNIQDRSGKIQIYLKKDEIGEEAFAKFKTFDLGDIVEVAGYPFITKTGEASLHVRQIRIVVKCLHPLPEKYHGLTYIEVKYRQRYLDLMVNSDSREVFKKRAKIISLVRRFFDDRDYVEVETPVMNTLASGASAKPFKTHHNALDLGLFLRIAPELALKKLVVGGLERVYELGKVFRNEGISTEHNPEFTMLEFYQAYATYEDMMNLTEELIISLFDTVRGSREIVFNGKEISMEGPWKRLTMKDAIVELGKIPNEIDLDTLEGVHAAGKHLGSDDVSEIADYGKALYEVFDRHIESLIVNPTFITQHPMSISPLSRPNLDDPRFTDRFELMVGGMEIANAFSELNDAADQNERFNSQLEAKTGGDEEAMDKDADFVTALEYGLPPTAGEGIGIDRLVMLLTESKSIRDVILFPTMRPLS